MSMLPRKCSEIQTRLFSIGPRLKGTIQARLASHVGLVLNHLLLEFQSILVAASKPYADRMPNEDRILSETDKDKPDLECPPLIVFCDDMSGNSTTQWNVHYSCYMSNACLPRTSLEQETNVHFLTTSPHASPMELLQAICESIQLSLFHFLCCSLCIHTLKSYPEKLVGKLQ